MALDVFDIKLGGETKPPLTDETKGLIAVKMLDAIQSVVDVLTDNDGGKGWTVSFDPGMDAYTDRTSGKRAIVVSGKPLLDAKPGTSLVDIAAIMTGFAVHEVGHTKVDFFEAVRRRWPGKQLPLVLANIIEDVVLELRTVDRYRGFADHGEGNIFWPTLEWVAKETCPKTPLKWSGSTGHKVNVAGQIVRYRPFVSFANDAPTQAALAWVETEWAPGITIDLTPEGCVALIERFLDYVKATKLDDEPQPEPPDTGCPIGPKGPKGDDEGPQTLPNEDDDDDEPKGSDGGDEPGGDDEGPDGGTEGGSEPGGDEPGGDTEGGDDGEGKSGDGDGPGRDGDGNDADHGNRTEAPKGANDTEGAGGTGQAVAEASDEVDDFEPEDLPRTFDDLGKVEDEDRFNQHALNTAEQEERVTTRLDAGAFGKMRVIFR